jgi:hypothetical protein
MIRGGATVPTQSVDGGRPRRLAGRAPQRHPARRQLPRRVPEGANRVRRRFNVAELEAVYIRDRKIGRVEFAEVFAPLFSHPSSNKRAESGPRGTLFELS